MLVLPLLLLLPLLHEAQAATPSPAGAGAASETATASAAVPDRTLPAPGSRVLATVQGRGVQIYTCSLHQGAAGWALQAPEATLLLNDAPVGTHGAGPSWHWNDGSAIAGNVVASMPSQQAGNVATLLVEAFPVGNTRGFLSNVLWVRRSGANGGVPPADGCDSAHLGGAVRVPYTATYTFYGSTSSVGPR